MALGLICCTISIVHHACREQNPPAPNGSLDRVRRPSAWVQLPQGDPLAKCTPLAKRLEMPHTTDVWPSVMRSPRDLCYSSHRDVVVDGALQPPTGDRHPPTVDGCPTTKWQFLYARCFALFSFFRAFRAQGTGVVLILDCKGMESAACAQGGSFSTWGKGGGGQ